MKNNWDFLESRSEVERAYLAGLLDADGCITYINHRSRGGAPQLIVAVANTNQRVLYHLKRLWGGCVSTGQWRVASVGAEKILEKILPYLIIKEDRALLALIFREAESWEEKLRLAKIGRSLNSKKGRRTW